MNKVVDNTNSKKKSDIPKEEESKKNYIYRAQFKSNLKSRSKNEIIDMTIDIWSQYEELQKAYKRMAEYTTQAIHIITEKNIPFPSPEEFNVLKDEETKEFANVKKN